MPSEPPLGGGLAESHPQLVRQWLCEKNAPLTPASVSAGSTRRVWWLCELDHEQEAQVRRRVRFGCTVCSGKQVLAGFNDLATTHPQVATQWHPTRNKDLTPQSVTRGTNRKAWWRCHLNHEWEATVSSRTNLGAGCPFCSGKYVLAGFNDLATTHPKLAAQWHPENNGDLDPTKVAAGTHRPIWWLCPFGHAWKAPGADRVARGDGCAVCSNRQIHVGFNDLATTHPDLAVEWHPEKNGTLTPQNVVAGSHRKAWWHCALGHSYRAVIKNRSAKGSGCARCVAHTWASAAEDELSHFLEELVGYPPERAKFLRSGDKVSNFDICLTEHRILVEYNGLYWHTEDAGASSEYHQNKVKVAAEHGYRLIFVWEDDWRDRRAVVERLLAHKLGVSALPRAGARTTQVCELTTQQAGAFLDAHHIQGRAHGGLRLGLTHPEHGLVAVLVAKVDGQAAEIVRYATSTVVSGGFSKLLRSLEENLTRRYPNVSRVKTFADHAVSDGALYAQTGFTAETVLDPDYTYLVAGRREHKFNFRVNRFRTDPALEFEEGLTESQLAELNKLPRIFDAGKTRWVKQIRRT